MIKGAWEKSGWFVVMVVDHSGQDKEETGSKIKQFRQGKKKKSYHQPAYCKCGTILKDFDFNVLFVVSFYS